MYAIAKHKPGSAKKTKTAPISITHQIELWWTGKLPAVQIAEMMPKLGAIRSDEMWIACGCSKDPENPPLFTVAKFEGTLYLRRLAHRGEHTQICPFKFDIRKPGTTVDVAPESPENNEPTTQPSFLEEDEPDGLSRPPEPAKEPAIGRPAAARIPTLARQLFWLLNKSGLQRLPFANTPAKALLATAESIPLKMGLMLSDILFCNGDAWRMSWMDGALSRCSEAHVPQQAILICPVVEADRGAGWVRFEANGPQVPISGSLAIWGDDGAPARFPMLMYAKVLCNSGDAPRIAKAYLHPVSSHWSWMIVDSNYERAALNIIQSACAKLKLKGIDCNIDKPVYNWGETGARPDFVISGRKDGKEFILVVETMGMEDPDYLESKKRTVAKLAGFRVFQDLRYKKKPSPDQALMKYIIGAMQGELL